MGVLGRAVPETNNKLPEIVSASSLTIIAHPFRSEADPVPRSLRSSRSPLIMLASLAQVFATYQMMFACLVPAIVLGAACERSRVLPAMVWVFCWTTLVYDPLAHWIWSSNGWAFKWGVYDCECSAGAQPGVSFGFRYMSLIVPMRGRVDRQTPVGSPSRSLLGSVDSPTRISSASDVATGPNVSSTNPTTSVTSSSAQCSSGSDGSVSTPVAPLPPT